MTMKEFGALKWPEPFAETDPDLQEKIIYWHGEDYAEEFFNLLRLAGGAYGTGFFDIRERLGRVQCPSLVIYPDRSALFDVQQGVDFYKAVFNQTRLEFANLKRSLIEAHVETMRREGMLR